MLTSSTYDFSLKNPQQSFLGKHRFNLSHAQSDNCMQKMWNFRLQKIAETLHF